MIDLAIIGGGPAGTAAALEARRRGMSVVIWESDEFPRDKVCGEFLSPESLPLLHDEVPATLARGAPVLRSEFISPSGRVHAFTLPRPGRGLSRLVMDEALWQAAATAGAHTYGGEAIQRLHQLNRQGSEEWSWELKSASGAACTARALVIACGRWWTLDGFPSPARQVRKDAGGPWMGAKAHFKGLTQRDAVEMYYFPGGYCGLAPIEDGMYNACCLVHRDLVRDARAAEFRNFADWLNTVASHPALEARMHGAAQVSDTVSTAPVRPARRHSHQEGVLLVGDASGFLDPFTGDGISMALHSGRLAVDELARARSNNPVSSEHIARSYQRRLGRAVRRSYFVAGALRALVRAPAFVQRSAAASLRRLGPRLLAETRWRTSL